jgi:hypothetical protein
VREALRRQRDFKAMANHADGRGTRRVQFAEAARAAVWLQTIANFAEAKDDWDLLDESARTMCTWDAAWDQWSAQDRIAPWLRSLSGQAARSRPIKWCRRAGSRNARVSARGVHPLAVHAP